MRFFLIFLCFCCFDLLGQYPPAAGQAGSTALYKDSSCFVAWATSCNVIRGYQQINDTTLGLANVGDSSMALGNAGTNGVVSLGDGGSAVLGFSQPIINGIGWDFAVFENSFLDNFLELAFVEVSSDGINFFRFPSVSLTDTIKQLDGFGLLDPTKINNLAGKYRVFYGTPFDLEEMKNIIGLDVNNITHVRIIDVVGSINPLYASRDSEGHIINDPWPTPFPSSGIDIDAIGVIHQKPLSVINNNSLSLKIFPNILQKGSQLNFVSSASGNYQMKIYSISGAMIFQETIYIREGLNRLNIDLNNGMYILSLKDQITNTYEKFVVK